MPRKSAAAAAILSFRPRPHLAPSPGAPPEVRKLFSELVASVPEGHFVVSDAPLLEEYATAIHWARQATLALAKQGPLNIEGRPSGWVAIQEKASKAIVALSARLRLSPQHREQSRTVGRAAHKLPPSPYEAMT